MANNYAVKHTEGKTKKVHILIAEKALGKPLPKGAHVHHVNGNKLDNRPENLVICPNDAYHRLLHKRTKAVEAGYPANYRRCKLCKQWDAPESLEFFSGIGSDGYRVEVAEHYMCRVAYREQRKMLRLVK